MTRLRNFTAGFLACAALILLTSCGGGGNKQITITLTTQDGVLSVDEFESTLLPGQQQPVLNFTAAVGGDPANQGVNWPTSSSGKNSAESLTGADCSGWGTGPGECGTVTNTTAFSGTYTPPQLSTTTSLSVTLKVAAISNPSVTKTATITVVSPPLFTVTGCNPPNPPLDSQASPCVLPSGSNGVPYISSGTNQVTIAFTGGVPPYNMTVTSYATPLTLAQLCLSMTSSTTATNATISGTPCSFGTTEFEVTVVDNQNNPDAASPPVSQWYQITIAPPPPLSLLTNSLPPAPLHAQYSAAVVAQGGVPPLTWTLSPANSLPPGIAFNSSTGQFSGIPTAAALTTSTCGGPNGTYCFTVQVHDSALPMNQVAPATPLPLMITVQQPAPLQITTSNLPNGTTAMGYSGNLNATGGVPPYTWSITQGQLPAGLTLSTQNNGTGSITGLPVVAGSSTFTAEVSDSEIPAVTKTMQFTITINPNGSSTCSTSLSASSNDNLLQGSFAYFFNGFDTGGSVLIEGQLTLDGKGNVTSGLANSNRISGVSLNATVTGSYCLNSDGTGLMELAAAYKNEALLTEDYHLVLNSSGGARFFEDNSTNTNTDSPFNTHGEGTLKPQLSSGFSDVNFSGHYAFLFPGEDASAKPAALGGVIVANGSSDTLLPGTGDLNDAGSLNSAINITGTFGSISGNQGTASFTFPVTSGQTTLNFIFVFVSPSDLYFMECDTANTKLGVCAPGAPTLERLGGEMVLQNPTALFNNAAIDGASVVSGIGVNSSGNSDVFAGLLNAGASCDGSTANVTLNYTENSGGTISTPSFAAGTCTVGQNGNGRVAFAGLGASPATTRVAMAYLTDIGTGFILGTDSAVTTGMLEQQSGGPFSAASVYGGYTLGTPLIAETNVKNVIGQIQSDGAGNIFATQLINTNTLTVSFVDEIDPPATNAPNLDQPLSATLSGIGANGQGIFTPTGTVPDGIPASGAFYIVSPGSFRMVSTDPSDTHPNLFLFDH